jgi:CDP-diacylglycerol--serine O-phosphatidyltransferase
LRKRREKIPFRKLVPNMITSGNMLCGMLSLVLTLHGHYVPSVILIYMAVVFDFMDGKVARLMGGSSAFGGELDSLADVVSFGVAPAMLIYAYYLRGFGGAMGALAVAFFALCGALRLARFNVEHAPGPFKGLPIPAGGHFLASFVFAGIAVHPAVMALIAVGTGLLMISSVPFGNLKGIKKGFLNKQKAAFLWVLAFSLIFVLREKAPLAGIGIYIASGFVGIDWSKWLSYQEDEAYTRKNND